MLFDWFTVGAQALNFLMLVWLMKRFLYQPILNAIDAREQRVAAELAEAGATRLKALSEREEFHQRSAQFDQQRAALWDEATAGAKTERQRLIEEARQAIDKTSVARLETLRSDARDLNASIGLRTQREVFAVTRRVLTDLASASLEERMADVLTRRLREMEPPVRERLRAALMGTQGVALLRSSFEMPAATRAVIQQALTESLSPDIQLRWEVAPDLISGIEFSVSGIKVSWSIAGYLTSLEERVGELLKQRGEIEADGDPKANARQPRAQSA